MSGMASEWHYTVLDLGEAECSERTTIELDRVNMIRSRLPFQRDADNFRLS